MISPQRGMLSEKEKIHLWIFLFACVLAMCGFFLSRFLLSAASIILIGNSFLQENRNERLQTVMLNPLLSGMTALFAIAFVSGIWSENKSAWLQTCIIKLPLLLFPFALVLQKGMNKKHWYMLSLVWMALVVSGSLWTMAQYLQAKESFEMLYKTAKVLPTWAADSHIRFSMAAVIALLLWLKMESENFTLPVWIKWTIRLLMLWLMLFLLILSAKTGWIGLFLVVLPLCLYQLSKGGYRKAALVALLFAIALPFIAYRTMPTLRTRVIYVMYQLKNFEQAKAEGVYSDHNRLLSIRAGHDVFADKWVLGVGYGDLKEATSRWFDEHAPQVPEPERFRPLNQWFHAGAAAGITGIAMVSLAVFLPFFHREWRRNKPALAFALFAALIFLYENLLEDQLGVFFYAFFMMWWNASNKFEPQAAL